MSARDHEVLANDAKAPEVQDLLGESSVYLPQPNPAGLGPIKISPEMEAFYRTTVGLPTREVGLMVGEGFASPGDLAFFDDCMVDQLVICLASKAKLKNYIK